jgi:hypothetical protein
MMRPHNTLERHHPLRRGFLLFRNLLLLLRSFRNVSIPFLPPEMRRRLASRRRNVLSVASGATGGEISEQANAVFTEPNGTTVTGIDGTANTIDKDVPTEEKSVKGCDLDSSGQDNLETKVGVGHNNTAVEEDASDKNLGAVQIEETPNEEPESNQQSSPMLTSSIELAPDTEEHVKSGTQVPVGADDFHLEAIDTAKPQLQPGCRRSCGSFRTDRCF